MTDGQVNRLRTYDGVRKRTSTSISLSPEEHALLGRLASYTGVGRSKSVALAVRYYAVAMGVDLEDE